MNKTLSAGVLLISGLLLGAWTSGIRLSVIPAALAQGKASPCSVRDSSDLVVVMVCTSSSVAQDWQAAAKQACGSRTACNVWVWDDPALAPTKAPMADDKLPKSQAAQAIAVWANDSQSLLQIRKRR